MRSGAVLGTSILALLLGTTLANAQHGQRDHEDHKHEGNVHQQEHGRQAQSHDRDDARGHEQRHEYREHEAVQRSERGGHGNGHLREVEGPSRDRTTCGKTSGNASVRTIGNESIVPGTNAAAITDTAFLTIASALILAGDTGFGSTTYPSWWSKVPHVSSSEASGLEWLIRAQKPGRLFGTGPTMSMWTTSMTDITCSTDSIRELPLPSTSRCSQEVQLPE